MSYVPAGICLWWPVRCLAIAILSIAACITSAFSNPIEIDFENWSDGYAYNFDDDGISSNTFSGMHQDADHRAYIDDDMPGRSGSTKALRVTYPKDKIGPPNTGANVEIILPQADEYYVSYYVRFDENFPWGKGSPHGGKIPGLASQGLCSGGDPDCTGDGFTARYMWNNNPDGRLTLYLYHLDKPGTYGDHIPVTFANEHSKVVPGTWHQIIQRVRQSTRSNYDGIIETWFDGKLVQARYNLRLDGDKVDRFYFSTFLGGSGTSYELPSTSYIWFDDIVISTDRSDMPWGYEVTYDGFEDGNLSSGIGWSDTQWSINDNIPNRNKVVADSNAPTGYATRIMKVGHIERGANLRGQSGVVLSFNHRTESLGSAESVVVEVSNDAGTNWTEVYRQFGGPDTSYEGIDIHLDALGWTYSDDFRVRFHNDTDSLNQFWYVTEIKLTEGQPLASDGFASGNLSGGDGWSDTQWSINNNIPNRNEVVSDSSSPSGNSVRLMKVGHIDRGINLAGASGVIVSFEHRKESLGSAEPVVLEASNDGGSTWAEVFREYGGSDTDFEKEDVFIDALGWTYSNNFRLRFRNATDSLGQYWYVTNIKVRIGQQMASDAFLSGDFSGGLGWSDASWSIYDNIPDRNLVQLDTQAPSGLAVRFLKLGSMERGIDLSGKSGVVLSFNHRKEGLSSSEAVVVEVSNNGGTSWTEAFRDYGGSDTPYEGIDIQLDNLGWTYSGNFRIRFRNLTGSVGEKWYVSDIRVTQGQSLAADGFTSGDFSGGSGWSDSSWSIYENLVNRNVVSSDTTSPSLYTARLMKLGFIERGVDLAGADAPTISFYHRREGLSSSEPVVLEVSNDGGNTWTEIFREYGGADTSYTKEDVSLGSLGWTFSSNFRMRFSNLSDNVGEKWYVTEIKLML